MNKILLVIRREYLVRVQKKSFLVLTLVTPLGILGLIAAIVAMALSGGEDKDIAVLDESGWFEGHLEDGRNISFTFSDLPRDSVMSQLRSGEIYGVLEIPKLALHESHGVKFHMEGNPTTAVTGAISREMENRIRDLKLSDAGISEQQLDSLEADVSIATFDISGADENEEGEQSSAGSAQTVGIALAVIIYMFIFIYGAMVMRGVIEEKLSRIVEVIVSSIKPFQLMMGKVIGVAAVGLTQLAIWVFLLAIGFIVLSGFLPEDAFNPDTMEQLSSAPGVNGVEEFFAENPEIAQTTYSIINMPWGMILITFLFFFVGGYLMYGALFAAIGSAVDSDADSQQFMLPITLPLIISYMAAFTIIREDPNGPAAFWLSQIPLTSPIVMTIRVPFGGVEVWELILSMVLLIAGFTGTIWLAGRIYRIGILMHGTKVNYKVLAKWVKMNN